MTATAKVIADSVSAEGIRITTFQLKYPRFIHSEFMTHRVFSRNASSSRAIPVMKMLKQVWNDPAMPLHWGQNQAGMQAKAELSGFKRWAAKTLWKAAGRVMCGAAWLMTKVGLHKQVANRILEPWQFIHVIVTATDWDNFFELRDHEDAQPEIRDLAIKMREAMAASAPQLLVGNRWHLPYVTQDEVAQYGFVLARKLSAARCCRVSYLTHDGRKPSVEEDLKLCERLAGARPIHASPFEHQASPDATDWHGNWAFPNLHGNLRGWVQYRKFIECEVNPNVASA